VSDHGKYCTQHEGALEAYISNMQQKISSSQYIAYKTGRVKLLHIAVFNKMLQKFSLLKGKKRMQYSKSIIH
jgi:hypothetical protein